MCVGSEKLSQCFNAKKTVELQVLSVGFMINLAGSHSGLSQRGKRQEGKRLMQDQTGYVTEADYLNKICKRDVLSLSFIATGGEPEVEKQR